LSVGCVQQQCEDWDGGKQAKREGHCEPSARGQSGKFRIRNPTPKSQPPSAAWTGLTPVILRGIRRSATVRYKSGEDPMGMGIRVGWATCLLAAGCATAPPLDNPVLVRSRDEAIENPVLVSPG